MQSRRIPWGSSRDFFTLLNRRDTGRRDRPAGLTRNHVKIHLDSTVVLNWARYARCKSSMNTYQLNECKVWISPNTVWIFARLMIALQRLRNKTYIRRKSIRNYIFTALSYLFDDRAAISGFWNTSCTTPSERIYKTSVWSTWWAIRILFSPAPKCGFS